MEKFPLKLTILLTTSCLIAACSSSNNAPADTTVKNDPPLNYSQLKYTNNTVPTAYSQAINFSKNLIEQKDPGTFMAITYEGENDSLMPDNRRSINIGVSAYLFTAAYVDKSINIYVNSAEFATRENAELEAKVYAKIIGQIPSVLRNGIVNVYLHKGSEPLVGIDDYLIIYSDFADFLSSEGILEEVIVRESAHVSLDAELASSNQWRLAQDEDGAAISVLASERSSEDAAESLLAYLAVRYRANRVSASVNETILATIPNRIRYFDSRGFDMHPVAIEQAGEWVNGSETNIDENQGDLLTSDLQMSYEQWEQKISF